MVNCRSPWSLALLVAASSAFPTSVRADDWAQFRKDADHTGASRDSIRLPLTEMWSWRPERLSPGLAYAAIWRGRAFFTATEEKKRFLICADARTGLVEWKQPLTSSLLIDRGSDLAISGGGWVYVYDQALVPRLQTLTPTENASYPQELQDLRAAENADAREKLRQSLIHYARGYFGFIPGLPEPPPGLRVTRSGSRGVSFSGELSLIHDLPDGRRSVQRAGETIQISQEFGTVIRTFSAITGQPGPMVALEPWITNEVFNYTALLDGPQRQAYGTLPSIAWGSLLFARLGPPTVVGDTLYATTNDAALLEWTPGGAGSPGRVLHTFFHHPVPGLPPADTPLADLSGIPPLVTSSGVLLGDDQRRRFLTLLSSREQIPDWHADLKGSLGIPASDGNSAYVGLSGADATRTLVCFDPGSGLVRWKYAPTGDPGDPQAVNRALTIGQATSTRKVAPLARLGKKPIVVEYNRRGSGAAGTQDVLMEVPVTWFYSELGKLSFSGSPSGWRYNPGVAITRETVYAVVAGAVTALDPATGEVRWRRPLAQAESVSSMIVAGKHLFLCGILSKGPRDDRGDSAPQEARSRIAAMRLSDGKPVWEMQVDAPGHLLSANGVLYLVNGALHAFGPSERTFRLAVDSPRRSDYRFKPSERKEQDEDDASGEVGAPEKSAPANPEPPGDQKAAEVEAQKKLPPRPTEIGDATVLRLSASGKLPDLIAAVRERRQVAPEAPLLLSLDPLDATRTHWTFSGPGAILSAEWIAAYARLCAETAAAGRPQYLEALVDANVYLAQFSQQQPALRRLIQAVAQEVHAASPGTQVVLSFNVEVLSERYSRGDYRLFGKLPPADPRLLRPVLELAADADAVGLTTYPQAAMVSAGQLTSGYLGGVRRLFGAKPVLITRMAVLLDEKLDPKIPGAQLEQARYVRQLLEDCYWLDAKVVAYPELWSGEKSAPTALRLADRERVALDAWQSVLASPLVEQLTLARKPDGEEKEQPGAGNAGTPGNP